MERIVGILQNHNINEVRHFTPLHYLPYIVRRGALLSKPSLRREGFAESHFRAKSYRQDIKRGFGDCAFLTLDFRARILKAKLEAGFPHIGISVPAENIEKVDFSLCRYNVAMTRRLKRRNQRGFDESPSNGHYYGCRQIPIAKNLEDKNALLNHHYGTGTMIEVIIHGDLILPSDTAIVCFCEEDVEIVRPILERFNSSWGVILEKPPGEYHRNLGYVKEILAFIDTLEKDPSWRGSGLDFDRLNHD